MLFCPLRSQIEGDRQPDRKGTYHDVNQPGYMPMRERLEDLNFALQVLEQLCREIVAFNGLDGDLVSRFLECV